MTTDYFHPVSHTSMADTPANNGTVNAIKGDSVIAHAKGSPGTYSAPSRVTLHLEHLPSKHIKAPWPRTPSRVCICIFSIS
jgi:hypothetical protein